MMCMSLDWTGESHTRTRISPEPGFGFGLYATVRFDHAGFEINHAAIARHLKSPSQASLRAFFQRCRTQYTNAVGVQKNLLDNGVVDTFGSVSATNGVRAADSINASDNAPSYSRQSALAA
jgi:hypothetical protein